MILKKIKIKDIGEIVTGKTPPTKSKEYYGNDFVFIKPTYIDMNNRYFENVVEKVSNEAFEKYKSSFVPANSTCVVTIGSIGEKICLTKEVSLTNQAINSIIPYKDKYDNIFIYYLLKYNLYKVKAINNGTSSGRENVSKTVFENIEVEVPDILKQRRIAKILSSYDDLIENNLKRIKLLEESADLLYKEWFVNFKFPGYEKCEFVDEKPNQWVKSKISDIAVIDSGYAFKSKTFQKHGNAIVKIKNIENNSINIIGCDCVEKNIVEKLSKFKLEAGELLIAMTGATVGKIGIMPRSQTECYLNQRVGRIKCKYDFDISTYIFCLFNSQYINNTIINRAKGAAQPNISTKEIENIQIIIPEQKILYKFENVCSYLLQSRLNLIEQNEKLKEARDILIPKLIMGEIEV